MCKICLNRFIKNGLELSEELPDRWTIYIEVNEKKSCKYSIVIYKPEFKKVIKSEIPNHENHIILLERTHSNSLTYREVKIPVNLDNKEYCNRVIEYLSLNSIEFFREIRINQLV